MKSILKITVLLLVLLSGCHDDNGKSKLEIKMDMLTASSWGNAKVTHNPDGDLSSQYTKFVITFSNDKTKGFNGVYFISNGGYAFSEITGKWMFNETMDKIILDSGKEMSIQLDENFLQLDFITIPSGGRVSGVSGNFVFDLESI